MILRMRCLSLLFRLIKDLRYLREMELLSILGFV
jgi:hypothetical protein